MSFSRNFFWDMISRAPDEGGGAAAAADAGGQAGADKGAAAGADAGAAEKGTIADGGGADKGAAASGADNKGADAGGADKGAQGVAAWKLPDNWRQDIAGDDKKLLARLERYASFPDYLKGTAELNRRMSAGEFKTPLPENATAEDIAKYRKDNGLPETAEAMVKGIELPKGIVVGEADKPLLENFAAAVFEGVGSQKELNRAVGWYYQMQDAVNAQRQQDDAKFHDTSEEALREEWKGDFRRNVTAIASTLDAYFPNGVGSKILAARGPDGRMLGDNPDFCRAMASIARELNPASTLLPAGTGDSMKDVTDRISEIEKTLRDTPDAYWKDQKMQDEYRELLGARSKMEARSKAA